MSRVKVTVVGAGNVGATTAQRLAERDYADVVLVDIVEGLPQGKALDLNETGPVVGYEPNVVGSNGYEETAGSDVCIITSGIARKPGMSRDDLLTTNQKIVGDVTRNLVDRSPDTILIVVRSEEHTSELQSRENLVCRLLLEKKKKNTSSPFLLNKKKK